MSGHAACRLGVIGYENVPFPYILAQAGDGVIHRHTDHHQHAVSSWGGENLPFDGDQSRAIILRLLHKYGVCSPGNDLSHFVDDRLKAIA